jgi:hypothetical protein
MGGSIMFLNFDVALAGLGVVIAITGCFVAGVTMELDGFQRSIRLKQITDVSLVLACLGVGIAMFAFMAPIIATHIY